MSIASGTPRPTISWLPLLSLWETQRMEENAKWQQKTPSIRFLLSIKLNVLLYLLTQKLRDNIKQYVKVLFCPLN